MNIFDALNKQVEESNKRWEEIDKIVEELKTRIDFDNDSVLARTVDLLFLLVEQLRPAAKAGEMVKDLQDELAALGGKK